MRPLVATLMMAFLSLVAAGCAVIPISHSERQLLEIENSGRSPGEFRRGGWIQDQPDELTPYRIHGGVGPASSSI